MYGDNMKKIVLLLVITFLLTGCGKSAESFDYTCKKVDETTDEYKTTTEVKFSFDSGKVYKLKSTITEEHQTDKSVNNSYIKYQTIYENYNENNIEAEYKKEDKKMTASYYLDKSDIDNMKVELPYNFKLSKTDFLKSMDDMNFKCTGK